MSRMTPELASALNRLLIKFNNSRPVNHIGVVTKYEEDEDIIVTIKDISEDEDITISFKENLLIVTDQEIQQGDTVVLIPVVGKYLIVRVKEGPVDWSHVEPYEQHLEEYEEHVEEYEEHVKAYNQHVEEYEEHVEGYEEHLTSFQQHLTSFQQHLTSFQQHLSSHP